jgi:hypothetical protein
MPLATALALMLTSILPLAPARADAKDDEAKAIATKVTAAGAAMFDSRDAKGLAQTYTDDGRLEIYSRESGDGSTLKVETRVGRAEVQGYYETLFKNESPIHAKNIVQAARFLGDDMIEFAGVFEPDSEAAEPLKLPFHQVRIRTGDSWKVVSMQVFVIPKK